MSDDKYLAMDATGEGPGILLTRRDVLKLLGSGVIILFGGDLLAGQRGRPGQSLPVDFNAFLRVGEDGTVTCFTGKIEMGQGIVTSLAQMLADELDIPLDSVKMVMGDTDLCPWDGGTHGSMTTRGFGPPLRSGRSAGQASAVGVGSGAAWDAG